MKGDYPKNYTLKTRSDEGHPIGEGGIPTGFEYSVGGRKKTYTC